MSNDSLSFGENAVRKRQSQEKYEWKQEVRDAVAACNIEIERGHSDNYIHLINILRDYLYPLVVHSQYTDSIEDYHLELEDDNYEWDWMALHTFSEHHDQYLQVLKTEYEESEASKLLLKKDGALPASEAAKDIPERAFRSIESITEYEGIVKDDMRNRADVFGFNHKIGVHRQSYDMEIGEPVKAKTHSSGELKTLNFGMTGSGKSLARKTSLEDDYSHGIKIIDIADLDKFENATYDIPQSNDYLRDIREEHGLGADFNDDEDVKNPELEVLHPLIQHTDEEWVEITVDDDEESVLEWFTIPASTISRSIFDSFFEQYLSDQNHKDFMTVFDSVSSNMDDWTLADLAEEVRGRDIDENAKSRIINALDALNTEGFIRDKSCPHALDTEDIYNATQTITSFSQAFLKSEASRLFLVAYLLDRIYRERRLGAYKRATIAIGEIADLAPHNRKTSDDSLAEAMQKGPIRSRLAKFMQKGRHYNGQVHADTQKANHLNRNIKEEFNRYVVFTSGTSKLKDLFDYIEGIDRDSYKSCAKTLNMETGVAAIVGLTEPTVNKREIDYISPVYFVPPSHHHIDTEEHDNGWLCRADLLDEELISPDVDGTLPKKYEINTSETEPDEYDEQNPMAFFVQECLMSTDDTDAYLETSTVRKLYELFANQHDLPALHDETSTFGTKLKEYIEVERGERAVGYVYQPLKMTEYGKDLLD